ncbi:hypothetical protein B4O97_17885 [Marispirochaeta aestuarii]|uniref:Xylose isomerase-like TIM barrel domain-containing protein n=1 Tax=Marispirochaeta aestuarii TaxID=1963862 RepID=A0A1Y1RTF5_9SPIO|nr:TIM barrel protein [Marispirochaeta aestuarii]ORC30709.1 hypothetical protein B4O97_17885 [Marispirochaeta aestuarii]
MNHNYDKTLLGISSYAYRWAFGFGEFVPDRVMQPEDLLERAYNYGLQSVQLCDNIPFLCYDDSRIHSLHDLASGYGISVETGIRGTEPGILRRALNISQGLGAKLLRIVVEVDRKSDLQSQLRSHADRIREASKEAKEKEIILAIENHATMSSRDMNFLIDTVDHENCGVCLDTMNSVLLLEKPEETVASLLPHVVSVHFKDFKIVKEPDCYRVVGTCLGAGEIDFPRLLDGILRSVTPYSIHVELYIPSHSTQTRTLQIEEDCVASSVEYLKSLL